MGKILDMSVYKDVSSYDKLAAELDFCILRASIGLKADAKYAKHAKELAARNVPLHAYHYMKATSPTAAISEAFVFWQAASAYSPISYVVDVEWEDLPTKDVAAIVRQFILELRRLGAEKVGLYIAHNRYKAYKIDTSLADWVWIPRYGKNDGKVPADKYKPDFPCDLWQYTDGGKIAGIDEGVDLNILNGDKSLEWFTGRAEQPAAPEDVRVGSARSSYGNTSAGDQNGGKEVSTQEWYPHSKGWVLLRCKDAAKREKHAVAMEHACANDDIGYSQGTRDTLRNNVKDKGYDPALTTKKVNCDCSSLVRVCANYAGISVGDFITSDQVKKLMTTGEYAKYTDDAHCASPDRLLRGDVLVTRTKGHTVIVLDDGALAAQEAEYAPPEEDKPVAPPAQETGNLTVRDGSWNVRSGPGTKFPSVAVVKGGEKLVAPKAEGWVPVLQDGEVRWISAKAVV